MRCERETLAGDPAAAAAALRQLVPAPAELTGVVAEIIDAVRERGEAAILEHTRRFDTGGAEPKPLVVAEGELDRALSDLPGDVRRALELAIEHVTRVCEGDRGDTETVIPMDGHAVTQRWAPVHRAGVYVPGGRAPYPSTVVMGVVPARVAGVPHVAVCSPPGPGGEIDATVLAACRLAGASAVYRMGGVQAIAALAYGTPPVARVDVIVGPGNLYVQEAKRQLSGEVGIDGFAGPSDLLVIADEGVEPEPLGLDLLAQAEHGPGTLVIAASPSPRLLDALEAQLREAPDTGAVAQLLEVADHEAALAYAEAFAPEHLELVGEAAEALAPRITRAGCVFIGAAAATAFGDYVAGSNHILPTNGAGRFASALSTRQFLRSFTEVRVEAADTLARAAAPLARAEGFELHARSMEARIRDNDGR
jgi:histidinol dehydrogenase